MKGNCSKLQRYNGTNWDTVSAKVSMSGPGLSRETVEEEPVIDCDASGGNKFKEKSPGTKEIGDITVEIKWNPTVPTGTKQIERSTAAGIVSAAGNALVTITKAGMTGSPIALNIPVSPGSPGSWAGEVRNYLATHAAAANIRAVAEVIDGAGTFIDLRALDAAADDGTFNIALATGTATGITAAPNSATLVAGVAGADNDENHHLFEDDFDKETATFWRIVHPNNAATGVLVHATVKEVGEPNYEPNQTVKRSIVIEPTGRHYKAGNAIAAEVLPVGILAPQDHYGHH
ncbi:hypothetical protein OJ996_23720 [Luteolibacter sp. GHJ8]|uniref:Uncharacterized protein n=1 Tax=Luteolibacter rhizosphaerae TaxID=2989719 RepID=A0ABT3G9U0_9BACT|nr:hypothetical protein [Luteolibacter rhizosphaerae]MCW1916616.1 hypothetical protein [Luteolibacter rhizosphaerae]